MKTKEITKLIALFLLLVFAGSLKAQMEFAPVGAKWNVLWQSNNTLNPIYITESIIVANDTVVDGVMYKKIMRKLSSEISSWQGNLEYDFYGLIREEFGKVLYSPANQDVEYLLYDFGMNVNEIAVMYYCQNINNEINVRVDSITTQYVAGADRRVFHISSKDSYDTEWMHTNTWVEGIGAMEGLFYNCHPVNAGGTTIHKLLCYHEKDELLFINEEFNLCEVDNNEENIEEIENEIAYFDIFSNQLHLQIYTDLVAINIYDINGINVFCKQVFSSFPLDLSFLSSGTYIVAIKSNNDIYSFKIVKL